MQSDMSKAVTCINPIINTACVSYRFPHQIKKWLQSVVLLFFVNNSNYFAFNFAVLHHWATGFLFVPQTLTLAGYSFFFWCFHIHVLSFHFEKLGICKGENYSVAAGILIPVTRPVLTEHTLY